MALGLLGFIKNNHPLTLFLAVPSWPFSSTIHLCVQEFLVFSQSIISKTCFITHRLCIYW